TTNIIRWRHKRGNLGRPELGDDGRALTESNTRLVRWSDGSTQLLVGDEAFDVEEHSIDRRAPCTILCGVILKSGGGLKAHAVRI
ncbi:unnamed protein product, partial [Ectocarpus sp. 12 AP-2014]